MILPEPKYLETLYVCQNLRKESHEEIFGVFEGDAETLAKTYDKAEGHKWVGYFNGKPAALFGALKAHSGVWTLFGFGTDDWAQIWKPVTKTMKRDMFRLVSEEGAHRASCISPASHTETHRWLKFLGAGHVAELPKFGKNGEDYLMFSWLREV